MMENTTIMHTCRNEETKVEDSCFFRHTETDKIPPQGCINSIAFKIISCCSSSSVQSISSVSPYTITVLSAVSFDVSAISCFRRSSCNTKRSYYKNDVTTIKLIIASYIVTIRIRFFKVVGGFGFDLGL